MRIIVTGADGFVGGYLIPKLHKYNHELFLLGSDKRELEKRYGANSICLSHIDIRQDKFRQEIKTFSPEVVIHLAAYYTASDEFADLEKLFTANILFLGKILDALKYTNLKCFIYTGSCTEFYKGDGIFDPAYLYSATKTAGRSILNYYSDIYGYKSIIVTPYTVYGGIDTQKKIIDILYESLDADHTISTTLGEQVLDFIHVSDLADLFYQIINNLDSVPDKTNFQAGTGIGNTLRDLVLLLEKASGRKANINWGGIPYRKKDTMFAVADTGNQKKFLNWTPAIDLVKGVKMYLKAKCALD